MQSRSERFDREVRGNFTNVVKAELFVAGESWGLIPVIGGDYSEEKTADVRRRCSLVLDPSMIPSSTYSRNEALWPSGNEVQLYSGISYGDKRGEELLPLGRYRIAKPQVTDTGDELALKVDGYDYSRTVARAGFTEPWQVSAGSDFGTEIMRILMGVGLGLGEEDFIFWPTDGSDGGPVFSTSEMLFTPDSDNPWAAVTTMAQLIGGEIFFDQRGKCVLRPEQDLRYEDPDWSYTEGEDTNLLNVDRSLDDESAYNGVIYTVTHSDNAFPMKAEIWDTNPDSPTYYDPEQPEASVYGRFPYFVSTEAVMSVTQIYTAAKAAFFRVAGIAETLSFDVIPHPAHEIGDILEVVRLKANVNGYYILDSLKAGLGEAGVMNMTAQSRRLT